MKELKIPEATVSRLSVYSRYLTEVEKQGIVSISSGEIAEGVGERQRRSERIWPILGSLAPVAWAIM